MKILLAPFTALALLLAGVSGQTIAEEAAPKTASPATDLTIYTETYPPFNYEEIGEARGLSVDLLLEMFARANIKKERHDIIVAPWATGLAEVQSKPNTVLFSTVRTAARENQFKWVGPIGTSSIVLIARRDNDIDVSKTEDFKKYKYGIVQDSSGDEALREAGADSQSFIYLNSPLSAAHMLARGRVDAWAFERIVSFWVLQKLGYRAQDFKVVHAFNKHQYYFAFNPDTDPALIAKLQSALDAIIADGTIISIVEGFIPGASDSFLRPMN